MMLASFFSLSLPVRVFFSLILNSSIRNLIHKNYFSHLQFEIVVKIKIQRNIERNELTEKPSEKNVWLKCVIL